MGFNTQEIYKSNSDLLKAEDIGHGMPTVTISNVSLKEFDNGERKLALHFHGKDKIMTLNKTNANAMENLYGPNTDNWLNKQIMLFTMNVDYQGKQTLGLRIRAPQGFVSGLPSHQAPMGDPRGNVPPASSPTEYGGAMSDDIPFAPEWR